MPDGSPRHQRRDDAGGGRPAPARPAAARAVERWHHPRAAGGRSGSSLYLAVDRSLSSAGTAAARQPGEPADRARRQARTTTFRRAASSSAARGPARSPGRLRAAGAPVGPVGRTVPTGLPVDGVDRGRQRRPARDIREDHGPYPGPSGSPVARNRQRRSGVTTTPVRVLTDPVDVPRPPAVRPDRRRPDDGGAHAQRPRSSCSWSAARSRCSSPPGVGAAYASRALVPIRQSLVGQREALRRQREFAADASHELRTPLTVIRASVDDLERHPKQPVATVGTALTDIRDEVDHLTAMVDDLLLLARSDFGRDRARAGAARPGRRRVVRAPRRSACWPRSGRSGCSSTRPRPRCPATRHASASSSASSSTTRIRHAPAGSGVDVRVRTDGPGRGPRRRGRGAGHPPRGPAARLRPLLSGGRLARWRDRPGPGDRGLDRRAARGPDRGREPRVGRGALHGPAAAAPSALARTAPPT